VFDDAVASVLGRPAGDHRVVMGGKTDPQIVLEVLAFALADAGGGDEHVPAVLEALEKGLQAAAEELRRDGCQLPGVAEVLPRLDAAGTRQTLLTGNSAANAAVKVAAFGLSSWLDLEIGAYGSDDPNRNALVPVALERARRLRALDIDPAEVWVVGDTPRDLACARAGGTRCLLVATGHCGLDELRAAGADEVLEDLADVDAVVDLLLA
nr:haloacid dehalogenase-like hydrolase [Acidimicrobiia bacterium]